MYTKVQPWNIYLIEQINIPALILGKKCRGFELMSSSLPNEFSPAEISHLFIQSVHFKKS